MKIMYFKEKYTVSYYTEWARKKEPAFRFARVLATVLISVFTLCCRPGLHFRGPTSRVQNRRQATFSV